MKKTVSILLSAIIILSLCGCGVLGGQSEFALKRIIQNSNAFNGSDMDDVEVVTSANFTQTVDGLASGKNIQLLLIEYELFDNDDSYMICAVNYDSKNLTSFEYGSYFPLTAVADGCIKKLNEKKQIENFKIVYDYITTYGFNCFEKENICDDYISSIISVGNIITLDDARSAIEAALPLEMSDYNTYDDVRVIYNDGSAIPQYYAYKTTSMDRNPNWGYIDTSDLNYIQIDFLTTRLGPLMIEQTKWRALDSNFNEMDSSFCEETFDALKAVLLNPESSLYQDNRGSEDIVIPDVPPATPRYVPPQVSTPDYSTQSDSWYRVRKSAGDAQSQIGAFKVFNNAKKLADQRRSEGYEVYDTHGNLVYMP